MKKRKWLYLFLSMILIVEPIGAFADTLTPNTENTTLNSSEVNETSNPGTPLEKTTNSITSGIQATANSSDTSSTDLSGNTVSSSMEQSEGAVGSTTASSAIEETDESITSVGNETSESSSTNHTSNSSTNNSSDVKTTETSKIKEKKTTKKNLRVASSNPINIDPGDVKLFGEELVGKYPLGIGTRFTAFAGETLSFGQYQDINFDGTYAAKNMKLIHWGNTYFANTRPNPLPESWSDYPFKDEKGNPLVLIGDTYLGEAKNAFVSAANFKEHQNILFESMKDKIIGDTLSVTPSQMQVGEISDFKNNLGTKADGTFFTANEYFDRAKTQLISVSDYYKAFTAQQAAIGNESIDGSKLKPAKVEKVNGWINEIQVNVPQLKERQKNAVAMYNLSSQVIGAKGTYSMKIILDNVDANTQTKDLPFIIFNWNDLIEFGWAQGGEGHMNFVFRTYDKSGNPVDTEAPNDFFKKMGSHIIHNYPDTKNLELTLGSNSKTFAGTVLAPRGNITLASSNSSGDAFWGSLISGKDITMQYQVSQEKAFGSVFDADNLPDTRVLLPGIFFTTKEITTNRNENPNLEFEIKGIYKNYNLEFSIVDSKGTKVSEYNMENVNAGKTTTTITKEHIPKDIGDYTIEVSLISWEYNDKIVYASDSDKFQGHLSDKMVLHIIDGGSLKLLKVPDIVFGSKTQNEASVKSVVKTQSGETFNVGEIQKDVKYSANDILKVDGQKNLEDLTAYVIGYNVDHSKDTDDFQATKDGNNEGVLAIEDTRNNGNWQLSVALGNFYPYPQKDDSNTSGITGVLNLGLYSDSGLLQLTSNGKDLSPADKKDSYIYQVNANPYSDSDDKGSSLVLKKVPTPTEEPQTYHGTVTWTLSDTLN